MSGKQEAVSGNLSEVQISANEFQAPLDPQLLDSENAEFVREVRSSLDPNNDWENLDVDVDEEGMLKLSSSNEAVLAELSPAEGYQIFSDVMVTIIPKMFKKTALHSKKVLLPKMFKKVVSAFSGLPGVTASAISDERILKLIHLAVGECGDTRLTITNLPLVQAAAPDGVQIFTRPYASLVETIPKTKAEILAVLKSIREALEVELEKLFQKLGVRAFDLDALIRECKALLEGYTSFTKVLAAAQAQRRANPSRGGSRAISRSTSRTPAKRTRDPFDFDLNDTAPKRRGLSSSPPSDHRSARMRIAAAPSSVPRGIRRIRPTALRVPAENIPTGLRVQSDQPNSDFVTIPKT
eukprot:989643_1